LTDNAELSRVHVTYQERFLLALFAVGLLMMNCNSRKAGDSNSRLDLSPVRSEDDAEGTGEDGEDPTTLPEGRDQEPGHAALLAEVDREIAAMKRSSYTHRTHVDEASGVFEYDCSGFVNYALARSVPSALVELRRATVHRPLAKHFVAFLNALPPAGNSRWR